MEVVNFPIVLPYTKSWYGKKAANTFIEGICKCAAKGKVHVAAGGKKECSLDYWVDNLVQSDEYRKRMKVNGKVDNSEKPPMVIRENSRVSTPF
jgi:C-22 sterol desaturase